MSSWRMMVVESTRALVSVPPFQGGKPTTALGPEDQVWVDDGNDKGYPRVVRFGDLIPLEELI